MGGGAVRERETQRERVREREGAIGALCHS